MKSTLRRRFALAAVVIGLHCMLTHRAPAQDANSKLAASADPSAGASAQRPEKPNVVELARGWRIKMGDDLSWSSPAFDDSRWERIRVGRSWENQGHAGYDGHAWYRIRFRLPESLRDHPAVQEYKSLRLLLGRIDDVDQTWLNGKVIGSTGSFAKPYVPAWDKQRIYQVRPSAIHWDGENVLAIRVYDGAGQGGMCEGACSLTTPMLSDFLQIGMDLGRGDGIFLDEGGLPIAATLRNKTAAAVTGVVIWEIKDDEGNAIASPAVTTTIEAHDEVRVVSSSRPAAPGFYQVSCRFRVRQETDVVESMILGYRPEKIEAPLTRPEDFDQFWKSTLEALARVDPQYRMSHHPKMDSNTHKVYEVEMRSLGGVRVRGWYEQPVAVGRHPALLRVPGYGGNMKPTGGGRPLAILSFNIRGHGNSQDDVPGTPQDFWVRGLDARQGYFYQGAYADCVRAVDFLVSRPEVDDGRIAVTGGSQGGGLSLATAALDSRIALCAPDIAFLCNWDKYFQATDWPEMNAWVDAEPHRTWSTTLRTLSYFDTMNMADRIQCPVLMGLGLQDDVCPAATIFAVYNRINVAKEYYVYPYAKHSVGVSHAQTQSDWIDRHFLTESGESTRK
jgi:cephalosporin-C deacetylase-like acetyl esterase